MRVEYVDVLLRQRRRMLWWSLMLKCMSGVFCNINIASKRFMLVDAVNASNHLMTDNFLRMKICCTVKRIISAYSENCVGSVESLSWDRV